EVQWALAVLGGAPPTIVVTGPDAGPVAAALGAVPLRELASTTADIEAGAVAVGLATAGRHGIGFEVGARAAGASLRAVAARGRAASFDTVEALRRALASTPFLTEVTADETRATVDGRGVEFRLRAARRPSGASS